MVRSLYSAVVKWSFADLVWWPGTDKDWARKLLGRIQRLACVAMTGHFALPQRRHYWCVSAGGGKGCCCEIECAGKEPSRRRRRGHSSILDAVVGRYMILGSVTDSMVVVLELHIWDTFEFPRKGLWQEDKGCLEGSGTHSSQRWIPVLGLASTGTKYTTRILWSMSSISIYWTTLA